ncbi:hypothetical protein PHMEG_00024664 [Phytophthora megakarya]|uniref:M96 mating-specific protein n=1 Tax=Phytophthora megakarya TaxID=4795 RepID=A0A225VFL3_9STRA|nr:hypothetical protein PHMEG_00024664 [Phytophthora megakarya]
MLSASPPTEVLRFPKKTSLRQKDNSTKPFAQRQKLEIERLRREATTLEGELVRLQQQRRWLSTKTARRVKKSVPPKFVNMQGYRAIAPRKSVKHFVWKEIAKRQWEERMRAENLNQELRSCLEVESVVHQQLELLRQCLPDENASSNLFMSKFIPRINPVPNDEVVFNDLLTRAENVLLDVDFALRGAAYGDRDAHFMNASVLRIDNTEAFVVRSNTIMPFCFQVVSRAMWKVLSSDHLKDCCYSHRVVRKSEGSVAYSFGTRHTSHGISSDIRGKYVVRRFKDAERIIITTIGVYEPVELNGVPCTGIRCRQMTWIELISCGYMRTLARSQCRFVIEEDKANPGKRSSYPVFDVAKAVHERLAPAILSVLEKTLVDEDLNLYGKPCGVAV